MKKQQKKQAGFIVSAELVLIATILVIGMIVGLVAMRDALTAEMGDVAEAIGALDQSYFYEGILDTGTEAWVVGSSWTDAADDGIGPGFGNQGSAGDEEGMNFNIQPTGDEDITNMP